MNFCFSSFLANGGRPTFCLLLNQLTFELAMTQTFFRPELLKSSKMKYIFPISFIIVFFVIVYFLMNMDSSYDYILCRQSKDLYKMGIKDVVKSRDSFSHREYCLLKNGQEFYFQWDTSVDIEDKPRIWFKESSEIGDSIIKNSNEPFFTLRKKNGEEFIYYFDLCK